jgi:uracil-DNA glycosylase family protein
VGRVRRPDPPAPLLAVGPDAPLESVAEAALDCTACPLYRRATTTVFGEGPAPAPLMLVGEQPGDKEDLAGRPFVGPAGRLLDEALDDAGIDRSATYVTNAVKHFKWRPAGKVRLHQKPSAGEVGACRPWLVAEIERVDPRVLVALGATAAGTLLGPSFRLTRHRGEWLDHAIDGAAASTRVTATVHPSAVLRSRDRKEAYEALVADLRVVAEALRAS